MSKKIKAYIQAQKQQMEAAKNGLDLSPEAKKDLKKSRSNVTFINNPFDYARIVKGKVSRGSGYAADVDARRFERQFAGNEYPA